MKLWFIQLSLVANALVGCSQAEMAGGAGGSVAQKAKPKTNTQCLDGSSDKSESKTTNKTNNKTTPSEACGTVNPGPAGPVGPSGNKPPALRTDDGGLVVNVPVASVHIRVGVDHVTDFIVTQTEIYAVHHELAHPSFALIELYGADGKVIDTQQWTMSFPGCDPYPKYDANCQSTKIQLKAGTSIKGSLQKIKGRGYLNLIQAPGVVRVADCGRDDCGGYGVTGSRHSGASEYEWILR